MSADVVASPSVLSKSIQQLKLIEALGTNQWDIVKRAITDIESETSISKPYGSPLHLAVTLSKDDIVRKIIEEFCCQRINSTYYPTNYSLWLNEQNSPDGETPLHIAARLDRAEVVGMLLHTNLVVDTTRNAQGQIPEDLAKSARVSTLLKTNREEFASFIRERIARAVKTPEKATQTIVDMFNSSIRARSFLEVGWVDINAPVDSDLDQSLLHYAAKWEDMLLIEWCLLNGADINVKDRKGKKPVDLCHKKSIQIRERLKRAVSQTTILASNLANMSHSGPQSPSQLPTYQGTLMKWVNFATGYKQRHFVLENGVLSYYKIGEYPWSCRGSISMQSATVTFPDSNDKSRFDIVGKNATKFSLKARTPTDAKKWTWALMESKRCLEDALHGKTSATDGRHQPFDAAIENLASNATQNGTPCSPGESTAEPSPVIAPGYLPQAIQSSKLDATYLTQVLKVELDAQNKICENLISFLNGDKHQENLAEITTIMRDLANLLTTSNIRLQQVGNRLCGSISQRETEWQRKYQHENEIRRRWQDLVQRVLVDEHSVDPDMMKKGMLAIDDRRGSGSSFYSGTSDEREQYESAGGLDIFKTAIGMDTVSDEDVFYDADDNVEGNCNFIEHMLGFDALDDQTVTDVSKLSIGNQKFKSRSDANKITISSDYKIVPHDFLSLKDIRQLAQGYERFEKRRRTLPLDPSIGKPALNVWSFLKSAIGKDLTKVTLPVFFNEPLSMLQRMCEDIEYIELLELASVVGRPQALLQNRPSVAAELSRRGIDTSSITEETQSHLRLMFVAAFAMSNYSSTVGRTNKPFNPLLGETYELLDAEKGYRYVSEQVCHHPPISACYCDSADYAFWAEVNVKSKFWGKSLEIHPLGNCHVKLPIESDRDGHMDEHFSWKKVTTAVNNLIMGKLWIDHFGDMIVKNWRTGLECTLTFKSKSSGTGGAWFGWGGGKRAKKPEGSDGMHSAEENDGGEVVGILRDSSGRELWEIEGRWDTRLIARPKASHLVTAIKNEVILWERNPLPIHSKEYFNFTRFAMQLNEVSDVLRNLLPATDCRLREDQRHMEHGHWDKANNGKEELERWQRQNRAEIVQRYEATGTPDGPQHQARLGIRMGEDWWIPRWFVRDIDPDTNEEHWTFTGDYWKHRLKLIDGDERAWPDWIPNLYKR